MYATERKEQWLSPVTRGKISIGSESTRSNVNRYTQRRGGWTSGTKGHRQLGFPGKQ